MNLQFYLEKLFASDEFQNFIKENPSAYFCSGFFSINMEGKENIIHIDYVIPETKKIFSFQLNNKISIIPVEQSGGVVLEDISPDINFDFEEIEKIIEDKMKEQEIKNKTQKILLSLQKINKRDFLIGTIFISGFGMIKIKIDLEKEEITEFEKKSFFDMMKIIKK